MGKTQDNVEGVFPNLTNPETNDRLQEMAKEIAPLNAALRDDILLNETPFSRIKSVWERREKLKFNKEQRKLLEKTYKDFIRGGTNLSAEQKKRLRAINEELSVLSVKFSDNLLKETNAFHLIVEIKEELAGLPESALAAAAETAQRAGRSGEPLS